MGVKDSSGDFNNLLAYYTQTRNLLGTEFYVLSGNDSLILSTLIAGGAGGVAGCQMYITEFYFLYKLFKQGKLDESRAAQESIVSFRECFKYGNPNTIVKIAVRLLGHDVGECRKPFVDVSAEGMKKSNRY